jgi:hypothetical protein
MSQLTSINGSNQTNEAPQDRPKMELCENPAIGGRLFLSDCRSRASYSFVVLNNLGTTVDHECRFTTNA